MNIQDESQTIKKNKECKRSAKELPFSMEEFNSLKHQIGREKSVKKADTLKSKKSPKSSSKNTFIKTDVKHSIKGNGSERVKIERSESFKREMIAVK